MISGSSLKMPKEVLAAIRIKDWWHFILPPILGFYFLGVSLDKTIPDLNTILSEAILLLGLSVPMAALGFFINEWTDINDDQKAGKVNYAFSLTERTRWGVLLILMIGILIGQILFNLPFPVRILLVLQILFFILYSCMPFRLKRVTPAAIILDALYSGTIFYILALYLHTLHVRPEIIMMVFLTGMIKGARNIIYHFLQDELHDAVSGKKTIAHKVSRSGLLIWQEVMWYLEAFMLLLISYKSHSIIFWLLLTAISLLIIKRSYYTRMGIKGKEKWLAELNILYEVWLPLASIIGVFLYFGSLAQIIAVIVLILVFPGTLKIFSEIYIAIYNVYYIGYKIYYGISDLYFIHTKPHFDIGKYIRKIKGE